MTRRSGFTLIEVLIASAMSLMVLGVMIRIFWFGRNVEREARASYLIRQDVDIIFRQMQEELRATHLSSIRVSTDHNGFSMVSPYKDNKLTDLTLTEFGVVQWKSWVHFTVSEEAENTGTLIRWEAAYPKDTRVGHPSPNQPADVGSQKWALLNNVVRNERGPVRSKTGEKNYRLGDAADGGGLRLRFVRRNQGVDSLSDKNPAQQSDTQDPKWSQGSTRLVDCRLQVANVSGESGKLSVYTINFRVAPRN